jgi:ComF family protein
VLRAKSPQHELLAATLAELLWQARSDALASFQPDVIVAVPMFWGRRLLRRANSPEIIARILAARLHAPCCPLLARRRHTLPQGRLAAPARFENVRGAFSFRRNYDCSGARVLLVDDILTTGATCGEAAKVLRQHGASRVAVAVLARAEGPPGT